MLKDSIMVLAAKKLKAFSSDRKQHLLVLEVLGESTIIFLKEIIGGLILKILKDLTYEETAKAIQTILTITAWP